MGLISYKLGQQSIVLRVKILNSSLSTGAGLTGLTYESSGLVISTIADNESSPTYYTVAAGNVEDIITLGAYQAPSTGKCRFKQVSATYHPGVYELHLADARYSVANAKSLLVSVGGAANAAETDVVIPLTKVDPYDGVRGGMTALPNANAEAAGGLLTRGTGAGQINQAANGQIDVNVVYWSGGAVPAPAASGVPRIDIRYCIGRPIPDPGGTVYFKTYVGTDQPINSSGTGASALVKSDLQQIKSQTVTCSAAVTIGAYLGNATAAIVVDANGRLDISKIVGRAFSDPGSGVTVYPHWGTAEQLLVDINGAAHANVQYVANAPATAWPQGVYFPQNVASGSAQTSILNAVNAITTNTARSQPIVPVWFVRPTSGSTAYLVELYLYDLQGHLQAPDAAPTVHARNAAGTSRDDHLGSTTMTYVGTGHYKMTYTVQADDPMEAVYFDFTWAVGEVPMADAGVAVVQDGEIATITAAIAADTTELLTRIPDAAPGTEGGLPVADADGAVTLPIEPPQGYGGSAAAIWAYAERTLTGVGGVGTAVSQDPPAVDIEVNCFRNGTVPLSARIYRNNGALATPDSIAAISYTIYAVGSSGPNDWTAVEGHTARSLDPADVLWGELQSDTIAADWNFRHTPDVIFHPAFAQVDTPYLVEYRFTPTSGQLIVARFRVTVL